MLRIKRSVLPSAKICCPVGERPQKIQQMKDTYYNLLLKNKEETGGIHQDTLKMFFANNFPNNKIYVANNKASGCDGDLQLVLNDKGQMMSYHYRIKGYLNKFLKLTNKNINIMMHEFDHLVNSLYNPQNSAALFGFNRRAVNNANKTLCKSTNRMYINMRAQRYDNIYSRYLYSTIESDKGTLSFYNKFSKVDKSREAAIQKRIAQTKSQYSKAMDAVTPMVDGEKILVLKKHIRDLQSELEAYTTGTIYEANAEHADAVQNLLSQTNMIGYFENLKQNRQDIYSKTLNDFCKKMGLMEPDYQIKAETESTHIDYLFPEKIQMLKEMYLNEIKKARLAFRKDSKI